MTVVQKHIATLALLLSCAAAQDSTTRARVLNVITAREEGILRIEITLSAPVKPSAATAVHPDRILLDFPNTTSNDEIRNVPVHANGVRRVRTRRLSTRSLITRVVLDLDQAHPYTVKTEGNLIIIMVGPAEAVRAASHGAPVAATSGNLIGVFRRRREKAAPIAESNSTNDLPPAPPAIATGPAFKPPSSSSASTLPPERLMAAAPQSPSAAVAPDGSAGQVSFKQVQIASAEKPDARATSASKVIVFPPTDSLAPAAPPAALASVKSSEVTLPISGGLAPAAVPAVPAESATLITRSDDPSLRTVFRVKYVADGVAYLEGGRAQGLTGGMKLDVEDTNLPAEQGDSANAADPRVVAELEVSAVAETSAVTEIHSPKRPVKVGDLAYLSSGDTEALVQQRALSATRQYPAVISFTEGDTLDEEVRQEVPRPPLPSVNRARGRIGFDNIETISHGTSNVTSSDVGMIFRGDITRIGGRIGT